MYTPSFVKIPDGGLKIPPKLVELTWNDPSIEVSFSHTLCQPVADVVLIKFHKEFL